MILGELGLFDLSALALRRFTTRLLLVAHEIRAVLAHLLIRSYSRTNHRRNP